MRILFVPVNYNSYDHLEEFLQSVCLARQATVTVPPEVEVWIADNSTVRKDTGDYPAVFSDVSVRTFHYDNPGYLSAALQTIQKADAARYDYIIISNVDVRLAPSFLARLQEVRIGNRIAWLAPRIYSESEKRDVNPKITVRYDRKHLTLLRMLFRHPLLYYVYTKTLYRLRGRPTGASATPPQSIYAGHGSLMIFTGSFFAANPRLRYPVFLFCEEIFLAETVRHCGGETVYCPSIEVIDREHASTGLMHLSQYCRYNYDALTYIINIFYE